MTRYFSCGHRWEFLDYCPSHHRATRISYVAWTRLSDIQESADICDLCKGPAPCRHPSCPRSHEDESARRPT